MRYTNRGQWILTDHHDRLVLVGQKLHTGQSPATNLDGVARRLLVSQMAEARQQPDPDHLTKTATGKVDGQTWTTETHVILCPLTGRGLGVLGAYSPEGVSLAAPPLIGAWLHPVRPVSADGPPVPSVWHEALFELTGVDIYSVPRTDGLLMWPVQQVTTEFVHPDDRFATLAALDQFYSDETDAPRAHCFRAETDETHYLRWIGRRTNIAEAPMGVKCWAGGLVHAITWQQYVDSIHAPELHGVLNVAAMMAPPLFTVDREQRIGVTTENFQELKVEIPPDRQLSAVTDTDSYNHLLDAFERVKASKEVAKVQVPNVVLRTANGEKTVCMTVVANRLTPAVGDLYFYCTVSSSSNA